MAEKALYNRLGNRAVEIAQVLAEKKWIIEALAKIRQQLNCIQIERLHLESLKMQLRGETKAPGNMHDLQALAADKSVPSTSAVNLMQCAPKGTENNHGSGMGVTDEEIICNEQELDLLISDCLFGHGVGQSHNMEEDEEDDDDDIMIDMNMLMNGNPKSNEKSFTQL